MVQVKQAESSDKEEVSSDTYSTSEEDKNGALDAIL